MTPRSRAEIARRGCAPTSPSPVKGLRAYPRAQVRVMRGRGGVRLVRADRRVHAGRRPRTLRRRAGLPNSHHVLASFRSHRSKTTACVLRIASGGCIEHWTYGYCADYPCSHHTSCATCLRSRMCGWCDGLQTCMAVSTPALAPATHVNWSAHPSSTPRQPDAPTPYAFHRATTSSRSRLCARRTTTTRCARDDDIHDPPSWSPDVT